MRTPSDCYVGSPRELPSRLPAVSYADHMVVRRVRPHGDINYQGKRLFTTESLAGDYVGIEQIADDMSLLWYCNYPLGHLDHSNWQLIPARPKRLSAPEADHKP